MHFGDTDNLERIPFGLGISLMCLIFTSTPVQHFYGWRLWTLRGRRLSPFELALPIPVSVLSLASFGLVFGGCVMSAALFLRELRADTTSQ